MSIHTDPATIQPSADTVAYFEETPLAIRARLFDAMERYGNECSDRHEAIEAINAGRSAFWRTTNGQNQFGALLTSEANLGGDLVAFCNDRKAGRPAGFIFKHGLDVLIPLNRKAAYLLADAYEAFGEWREFTELEARRVRKAEAA